MALTGWIVAIIALLIFNTILGQIIYKKITPYYRPLYYKKTKDGPLINVRDLYPEFCTLDKLSYVRFSLAFIFFTPFRMLAQIIIATVLNLHMRFLIKISKKHYAIKEERDRFVRTVKRGTGWFIWVNGIRIINKKLDYEPVYKKYLGPDYKSDINDKDYAVITCNHTGFFVYYYLFNFFCRKYSYA